MADKLVDDIATMSFEAALAELEAIVSKLESGQAPLQESITIYERGEALKRHCEDLLKAAEMRIEKITLSRDGRPVGIDRTRIGEAIVEQGLAGVSPQLRIILSQILQGR